LTVDGGLEKEMALSEKNSAGCLHSAGFFGIFSTQTQDRIQDPDFKPKKWTASISEKIGIFSTFFSMHQHQKIDLGVSKNRGGPPK